MLETNIYVSIGGYTKGGRGDLVRETPNGFWFTRKDILRQFNVAGFSADDLPATKVFIPREQIDYILSLKD